MKTAEFRPSRVKDNFYAIARDFDRAAALAKLNRTQAFLLQHAREECWARSVKDNRGFEGKAKPFAFDVRALAPVLGEDPSVLYRNIKSLALMGILVPRGDGYVIGKDYRGWTTADGATPLLTPAQVEYAVAAATSDRSHRQPRVTKSSQRVTKKSQSSDEIVTPSDEKVTTCDEKVTPPIEDTRASEDFKKTEEDTPEPASRGERAATIPYPEGVDPQAPNLLTKADRAELDRVADLSDRYFPMLDQIRRVVTDRAGSYPVWAYGRALEDLRKAPRQKIGRAYFLAIIGRIAEAGEAATRPERPASVIGAAPGGYVPHNMTVLKDTGIIASRRAALLAKQGVA